MAKVCKTFDSVVDLVPGKDSIRIKVRVLRLWKVSAFLNPSETSSIEMVLVDEKGGKIHASIKKQFLYMFQSKIEEGEVYKMSYFSVDPQIDSDIGEYALSLISLAEVRSHVIDYEFLVDVIGLLTGISLTLYVRDGKITKMVVLELTDSTGKCECALFGDYADDITKKLGKGPGGIPVVVIQFAKVKIFRDQASIHNVINTTRILVDPDIPEVEHCFAWYLHGHHYSNDWGTCQTYNGDTTEKSLQIVRTAAEDCVKTIEEIEIKDIVPDQWFLKPKNVVNYRKRKNNVSYGHSGNMKRKKHSKNGKVKFI